MSKSKNQIITKNDLKAYRLFLKQEYRFGETFSNTLVPIFTFFFGVTIAIYSECQVDQLACFSTNLIFISTFLISLLLAIVFAFKYPAFKEMHVLIHELNSAIFYYKEMKNDNEFYCKLKSIEEKVLKLMKKYYSVSKINWK